MFKLIFSFLLIYFPLQNFSDTKSLNLNNLKPSPKKIPVTFEAHGIQRVDNYYWMRDDTRKDPEVIQHLNSENAYLEEWFLSENDIRDSLFEAVSYTHLTLPTKA